MYIVELIPVFRSLLIDVTFTVPFVAKVTALVFEIVLDLLRDIKIVESSHYFKQSIHILE